MSLQTAPPETELTCEYRGKKAPLFRVVLLNAFLTVLTLGFYRFWAKTRVRRYFWSATAPGGDPLEYTGNGVEKLLGFLIAVAFLAVYLGIFQLLLGFAGLSLFSGGTGAQDKALQLLLAQATLLAIIPFVFYAQYRARRYILSRTRWRGIRFGVDSAAWGYVWRAMGHWFLVILSLGLLLPRKTFWLEKYKIDRTWYGDARFTQGGNWPMLYRAMRHIFLAVGLFVVGLSLMFLQGVVSMKALASGDALAAATFTLYVLPLFLLCSLWLSYGYVYYSVTSFRLLAEKKQLGDSVKFATAPGPWRIFWRYVFGMLLTLLCVSLVMILAAFVGSIFGYSNINLDANITGALMTLDPLEIAYAVFVYLLIMGLFGVFMTIFITQPILGHYVAKTRILNAEVLHDIEQRSRDEMVEAEGFADALDVGAAI